MDETAQVVLLLLALFLTAGMLFSLRAGLFSPYFLFFAYLTIGIVIRGLYLLDDSAFDDTDFWSLVAPAVRHEYFSAYAEMFTAIIIAVLTSRLFARVPNSIEERFLHFFSFKEEEIHFTGTLLAGLFACLTFVVALGASQGGIAQAFALLQRRALVFGSEVFFIRNLSVVFSVAVALLVYKVNAQPQACGRIRTAIVISVVLMNLALLQMSGGRGEVVIQMLVLLYVRQRGLNRGSIGVNTTLLIGCVSSLVLVGGMAMRRSAQFGISLSEAIVDSTKTAGHTLSGAFCVTDLYLASRHFADSIGHDYGMQFLLYFVRIVPRSLWEQKPLDLSYTMRNFYFGDSLAGVIPTIFGEFYIAWGRFGIIVCGVFLGWMLSFLDRAYHYAQQDSQFALIYIQVAGLLVIYSLRGGLGISMFMLLYLLATMACFKLASRLRSLIQS